MYGRNVVCLNAMYCGNKNNAWWYDNTIAIRECAGKQANLSAKPSDEKSSIPLYQPGDQGLLMVHYYYY